ncbi:MAG: PaaI family thioesterase [Comamonadaceae bacterium]|uniref:PaaI family thioesterase n=2 Tax=Comamonadaceae TaxID=80864 RepID=A0A372EPR4_9BURK|nr:PaaI family thioesterase [Comamonadaceae bacterium]RFP82627.1 PaaI family thioesterase [Hydrogenophaga borbori]
MMEFSVRIPFVDLLGFRLERMEGGEAQMAYDPAPEHLNSFDVVHGGVGMTLLDVVMAHAARSLQTDMGCVTIEMKTSFVRAAKGPLVARGLVLHRTATMAFTEGRVLDASGKLCSHATGTFKFVPRLPTGAGRVNPLNRIPTD